MTLLIGIICGYLIGVLSIVVAIIVGQHFDEPDD